ncbi:cobalt ECF transporter T component CbiQ [Desulfopila sp. IMCC35006]|uniref:cobalt ECF transporter T component CbiQ n=1 Tax=Desulfopila sp. IMCC35006 TaxID=2569542 RepID=UPI0010ABCA7B|nr:cobalt ECF transporter T component CbiQ [Desulfopila sp. IMCC35006]TKB26263.1 cobalt ECF transporter T component CbiQ [Desulfopila sp. IMCC35006]
MMDERFATGNSLLHKRDPKVKVIVAAAYITVAAISNSFAVVSLALALAFLLLLLSRLDLRQVGKRLLAANTFTLFLWLTLPLTYGGEELTRLGAFSLSVEGIRLAALISLKTNCIVLSLITLLGTSRIASLGHALEGLHVSRRLCFMLLFSYRYIFVIYQEYQKLKRAAGMRCFVPATNIHTYRTYGYLFGMTLVRSWNRATRVHQAMLLRGFNGRLIPLEQRTVASNDIVFLVIGLAITATVASIPFFYR